MTTKRKKDKKEAEEKTSSKKAANAKREEEGTEETVSPKNTTASNTNKGEEEGTEEKTSLIAEAKVDKGKLTKMPSIKSSAAVNPAKGEEGGTKEKASKETEEAKVEKGKPSFLEDPSGDVASCVLEEEKNSKQALPKSNVLSETNKQNSIGTEKSKHIPHLQLPEIKTPTVARKPLFFPIQPKKEESQGINFSSSPFAKAKNESVAALTDFGIKLSNSATKLAKRNGILQFALTGGPQPFILVKMYPNGFWGEKKLFDALREKAKWLMPLEPYHTVFYYHKNGTPIRNARGYTVRLFGFPCGEVPTKESLFRVGQYLTQNINGMEGNNTVASVDKNELFFVPDPEGKCVWSDVIDNQGAYDLMLELANESASDSFYARHTDLVHAFFREGTFHPHLAQLIGAPANEVLPSFLPQPQPVSLDDTNDSNGVRVENGE